MRSKQSAKDNEKSKYVDDPLPLKLRQSIQSRGPTLSPGCDPDICAL